MNSDIERLARAAAKVNIAGVPGEEAYEAHLQGALPGYVPIVRAILEELRGPDGKMEEALMDAGYTELEEWTDPTDPGAMVACWQAMISHLLSDGE